jgi:hypothetical protein
MRWAAGAEGPWVTFYEALPEDLVGLSGALTARAEAQVTRLALIFALLDGGAEVGLDHLRAAIAVWDYCERSVRLIWGSRTANGVVERILPRLEEVGPAGLRRTDLHNILGRNVDASVIDAALAQLEAEGRIERFRVPTGGAPSQVVRLKAPKAPAEPGEGTKEPKEAPSPTPSEEPSVGRRHFFRFARWFGRRPTG